MKTFTTYAEKKAKQILNLLQGYTKGIRITAILILLLMGVSNAWGETVLFLKNTIPFNNGRYAYFYNSSYWDENKGAGSKNIASQCNSMTKLGWDGQFDIYVYQTSSNYKYVAIMDHSQNNYDNFWETQGCAATYDACDGLYDIKKPMMIPTSTNPFKKNQDKTQYYHFSWDVPTVWIKHPFGGGGWSYKQMTYNNDGTFSVDAEYSDGNGCDYGCQNNDNGKGGYIEQPTKTPNNTWSHLARFKMTFSGGSVKISITKLCKVTFNMNGHGSAIDAQNVLYKSKATQPSNPTASGYTFGGWYTDKNCTSAFDFNTEITDDKTLYAKWTATETKHKVTISYKSGDTNLQSATTQEVGEATAVSITAPEHTGYTFTGWTLGAGITNHSANTTTNPISITTNSTGSGYTLTANYTKNSYTFNLVQAEGGNATATVNGKAISSPETLEHGTQITLNATAADKYKFSKWVDDSGAQVSTDNPYTHTLTASTNIQPVFTNTNILYLKPNNNWKSDGAWFAACFCQTGSTNQYWVKMKDDDPCSSNSNGYYKAQIPEGDWDYVIFCRMSNGSGDLNWNNKWNQTADLELPNNDNNCFAVKDGTWDKGGGTWSKYTSNYVPLVYNVIVPANTPNCYIIGEWDGWVQFTEMTKVDDTHYTVSIPDACKNHGYKYCYGPSWGCEEVANTTLPTTTIADRTHKNQDEVKAWIKYCLVGNNNIGWSWNNAYSFDIAGDMSHNFDAKNYDIKVMSSIGKYYTHNEYTYNLHRSHTSVKIPHERGENNQLILQADLTGTYKFHFDPVSKLLTIEFPEKGYRLKITMEDGTVYTSNAVDNAEETLSFFAPGSEDTELKGTITLEQQGTHVEAIPSTSFKTSNVYTAKLNSAKNGITDIALYDGNYYIRTDGASGGWGNYTDNGNKMTYFVPREEEKYSYYWVEALPRASRDESNGVVNVKACVANEYNDNLAVMLGGDKFTSDSDGNVKIIDPDEHHREKINVRFGYNPKTNHFERAMLTGSGNINTFLNIFDPLPEGYLYKTNNQGTLETQLTAASKDNKFTDISNWVYERDVWVNIPQNEDVTVCLTAVSYNGARNSLFGFDDKAQTVPTQRTIVGAGSSTPSQKKMRVIYDFKTNRMIMAWMPGEYECTREEALIADVLFMRHENDLVPQLTMKDTDGEGGVTPQIKGIQSQFFALELENKQNNGGNHEEHYWITLPFNCVVGSISGVPGYMTVWGIQRYDGAERAQKGWFKETETFWKWLGPDDVMEAGVGYVLSFDKSAATWNTFDVHTEHDDGSVTTTQKSLLRLYFPSTEKGFTFKSTNSFEKEYPNEPCTIQREDRYKQDGNWKIIGPISYNSATADPTIKTGDNVWKPEADGDHVDVSGKWSAPMFRYRYEYDNKNRNSWKYIPEDGTQSTYNAFYGYMVQFAGLIKWSEISQTIHPRLRARTFTDQVPTNITTNLELVDAEGVQHDQTFVSLDIEGTTTYDLNKDLNKVFNNNFANIYTLSEGIPFAGNTLPMEKATVPVGVRIATTGEYTFRMPDGTEGISVTLVDNVTGTHTNMLLDEYTVTLPAGTIDNRFFLVVDPDRTATSVENIGEEAKGDKSKGVEKFLIDGKLFIRTADGIFDAKGQRL